MSGFEVFTTKQATSPRLLHEALENEKTIHGTPSSISIIAITKSGLENRPDSERENRKDGTL